MNLKNLWDNFTDKHSSLIIHPQYFIKKYSNHSINVALKYASGVLLDIGCGRMPYKKKFLTHVDKYIGLDHPKVAKLYKGNEKPDILADATDIPLPDKYCDTIICFQVLEHLPHPADAINKMSRVLKKNGTIIFSTIQLYPLHDKPHDYYRYTKYGLNNLLKQGGFVKIHHEEEGNVFVLMFQSFNIYLMFLLKNIIKHDLGKLFAVLIAPFFFTITTLINVITFPFLLLDKKSSFTIIHTVAARKK